MRASNRVRRFTWPVTFRVEDGRRFTVFAPVETPLILQEWYARRFGEAG